VKTIGRMFLITFGTLSLLLGMLGIVLPILPTTPFILLAAYCYLRGSKRLYQKLISHKTFGIYIKSYYEKKGIPLKTKVYALAMLWSSILFITFILIDRLVLRVVILLVASGVTIHILRQKTLRLEKEQSLPKNQLAERI